MPENTPKLVEFTLNVCAHTGDPGCLGWPDHHEGPCEMHEATFNQCAECGGDDVYASNWGEVCHDLTCSHYVAILPEYEP